MMKIHASSNITLKYGTVVIALTYFRLIYSRVTLIRYETIFGSFFEYLMMVSCKAFIDLHSDMSQYSISPLEILTFLAVPFVLCVN